MREVRGEDVADEVRDIQKNGIVRIARAVRIEAEHLLEVRLVSRTVAFRRRDAPEFRPRRRVAFDNAGVVTGLRSAR